MLSVAQGWRSMLMSKPCRHWLVVPRGASWPVPTLVILGRASPLVPIDAIEVTCGHSHVLRQRFLGCWVSGSESLALYPQTSTCFSLYTTGDMDGPPPQEEDFTSIPVADRLAHKNWKARVSAYESLIKSFQSSASDSDPVFKPYTNNPDLLKKIATDSNAVAQEKGIECLVAFVKFSGENAARTREVVVPALVDKCFGSTRAGTKNQAIELALQYVEVENGGTGVVVCASVPNQLLPKFISGYRRASCQA